MTGIMTQEQMAGHDAATYQFMGELAAAEAGIASVRERMHHMAGDKHSYRGRASAWQMSDGKAEDIVRQLLADGDKRDLSAGACPSDLVNRLDRLASEKTRLQELIHDMDVIWHEAGQWSRYIECTNSDGHIHRWYGCKTLNRGWYATSLTWRTGLSGKTVAEAIAELGPRLCSVCFPDAPVEHCRSLADITRAEREAAKLARQEAKFIKRLRPEETFRDSDGDRIETVAACKTLIREAVRAQFEVMWWESDEAARRWTSDAETFARIRASRAASEPRRQQDAQRAIETLLKREAAQSGTGATQREIDKIITNATTQQAKILQERGK